MNTTQRKFCSRVMVMVMATASISMTANGSAEEHDENRTKDVATGAAVGGGVGAAAGCLAAKLFNKKCSDGVKVGGVLGVAVGAKKGDEINAQRTGQAKSYADYNRQIVQRRSDISALEGSIQTVLASASTRKAQIGSLQAANAKTQQRLNQVSKLLADVNNDLTVVSDKKNALEQTNADLDQSLKELEMQNGMKLAEKESAKKDLMAQRARISQSFDNLSRAEQTLIAQRSELERAKRS